MSFSVRDQLDCDVIHPRILSEHSVRQLRKLLVVTTWQARPDFSDVLLHDVGVVEQPLPGRTYVDSALRCISKSIVNFMEYLSCVVEAAKQRTMTSLPAWWKQPVFARNASRVLRKTIRPKHFTADWTNELSISVVILETKKSKNPALRFLRRNYCRCHRTLLSLHTAP